MGAATDAGPGSAGPRTFFARSSPVEMLFGRWSVAVGAVITVGAAIGAVLADPGAPPGPVLCWFRGISGLPCPGCGLTRAVVSLARGDLLRSLELNPFGVLVLPWAVAAATFPFWPRTLRDRVRACLEWHRGGVDRGYRWTVVAFVGFGALRLVGVALGLWRWP